MSTSCQKKCKKYVKMLQTCKLNKMKHIIYTYTKLSFQEMWDLQNVQLFNQHF